MDGVQVSNDSGGEVRLSNVAGALGNWTTQVSVPITSPEGYDAVAYNGYLFAVAVGDQAYSAAILPFGTLGS